MLCLGRASTKRRRNDFLKFFAPREPNKYGIEQAGEPDAKGLLFLRLKNFETMCFQLTFLETLVARYPNVRVLKYLLIFVRTNCIYNFLKSYKDRCSLTFLITI